ncbi:MAG: DUF4910 domain-containing protein [Acidobacteriota bacterium]|nr:DUF4910 domain-containing protein [Acidobacteriota bacterium]
MVTHHSWIRKTAVAGLVFSMAFAGAAAQEKPLAGEALIRALVQEVSGEIAYRYTDGISKFDRVQASEGWRAAAEWIRDELASLGYADVEIEGWPSDGTIRYGSYRSVIGWRVQKAELWLVSPRRERLCSFEEIPLTLVKHSNAADVEAELIDVGTGIGEESYRGRDVRGKVVLATAATAQVMQEAVVKRGALGVLTYFPLEVRPGFPNMIRYTALWPRWEDRESMGFGFNITKLQGAVLKRMLEEGQKVIVRADVDAEYVKTKLETLTASFPGTEKPEEEILIVGHLCHPMPSANDNASGSGGMLEMARALKRMTEAGLVAPPKRTIRFLWVPEFNGLMPYILAHLDRTKRTLAAVNCDMIGEDLHKTGGTFAVFSTPHSNPSFLNDVMGNFAGLVESLDLTSLNGSRHPFVWKVAPYSGGSDHVVFNDGSLKVPSVMLNHGDTFHHTSLDTMDKVDATQLRRVAALTLGAAYYMATAGSGEAEAMARLTARNGLVRMARDYYDALEDLYAPGDAEALYRAYRHVLNVVSHSGKRESRAVLSAAVFMDGGGPSALKPYTSQIEALQLAFPKEAHTIYRALCARAGLPPRALAMTDTERRLSRLVPVRAETFIGPLQMDFLIEKAGPEAAAQVRVRGNSAYEALNHVDGRMSVHDIAQAVSASYGPLETQDVHDFFTVLEKAGLIVLKKK